MFNQHLFHGCASICHDAYCVGLLVDLIDLIVFVYHPQIGEYTSSVHIQEDN